MSIRTKLFQQLPWDGGLNTRLDAALIPTKQLTIADNLIFAEKGSRKTRNGFDLFDGVALLLTEASAGTTRTLVMDRSLTGIVSPGDDISVFHNNFNTDFDGSSFTVATLTTTTLTDDTITYTHPDSATISTTASTVAKLGLNETDISIIGLYDYFRDEGAGSKVRDLISVSDDGKVFEYGDNGIRAEITNGGTALSTPSIVTFEQINQKLIMGFDETGNTPKKLEASGGTITMDDLDGSPPNFSICSEHLSRLWTNDKADPDRLHYSSTGNPEEWNGLGDSGAIDIGIGDGDADGITAIFPTFKGDLFVAKNRRLYRVSGFTPESFQVSLVSSGIGVDSQNSIVQIDQDDMLFISERGFHRLSATAQYGDFASQFISANIQPSFRQFTNLPQTQGVYLPDLNSVAWSVNPGSDANQEVYLFNILLQEWYRWPDLSCQALSSRVFEGKEQLVLGTNNRRVQTLNDITSGIYSDYGNQAIPVRFKTGVIYPDQNSYTVKGWKKLNLMFVPQGSTSFTATIQIDTFQTQTVTFTQEGDFDALGIGFVLSESTMGINEVLSPVTLPIDGYGRGATLEINKSDADEVLEIYAFGFEYEPAETGQEVIIDTGAGGD